MQQGLLLAEASHGNLQQYIDKSNRFLVHATSTASLDIWLCDFGGSTCEDLGLDRGQFLMPASLSYTRVCVYPDKRYV